ncbi:hypothetical protein [Actinoplanes sp. DH11]|uniref:vWA domain-containing protein n=1 Tax=Actinoplanes sp. DH11 TaxID=2857011 RepID=UPI001E54884B|nr:hypothetical protein [Actinoplanes sp. DH11]
MTQPLNLILNVTPVQRGLFDRSAGTTPDVAVVYATGSGDVQYFGGRPLSKWEQTYGAYRTRYDVDTGDHRRTVELRSSPLPSRGDYYFFIATVDVAFRVHDPAQVVRRNIKDALPVVYGFLKTELRTITRGFGIEQSTQAEEAIRRRFAGPVELPDGLTIFELSPRLLPDAEASRYLQEKVEGARQLENNVVRHQVNVQQSLQQGELDRMQQMARIQATQMELTAMGGQEMSARQMAMLHLARHPEDTAKVMALLLDHEQAELQRQDQQAIQATNLFKFLAEQGLFQSPDVERVVPAVMQHMGIGTAPAPIQAAPWTQPSVLPAAPAPAAVTAPAAPGTVPAQGKPPAVVLQQDPGSKVWKPADGVQPIYLVVDESDAVLPYIGDLTDGVHALHETLLQAGDVTAALRLAVLGLADETATRRPLEPITAGGQSPWFSARGPARYGSAFETLMDVIDQDIPMLKQEQPKVLRPTVYLLSGSNAADAWDSAYQRLTDRGTHRYAPNIVACGFGAAPATLINRIATDPALGFVMEPGADAHAALGQYWRSLARQILASGKALIDGSTDLTYQPPAGFRLARELV